ncbi:MAG: putative bifunctional diguanylate cyclase/phosphodiesterase [Candidatus Nanopelagicales bacterium]
MRGVQHMGLRLWVCTAVFVVFAILMSFQLLPGSVGAIVSYSVRTVTVLVAAWAMAAASRRADGRLRRARLLISLSLIAGALGGASSVTITLVTGELPPIPSVGDFLFFALLPLTIAGLLSYPVSNDRLGSGARSLLDGAVAAAGLWFVVYSVLLEPTNVGDGRPALAQLVILGYPATDVFIIAMAAGVLVRVNERARKELIILAVGLSLVALSDIFYTSLAASGRYRPESWVVVVAEAGLLLVLIGAWSANTADRSISQQTRVHLGLVQRWSQPLYLLPLVPVALAVVVGTAQWFEGGPPTSAGVAILLVMITLLAVREIVGNRDRIALLRRVRNREQLFRSLVVGSSDLVTLHEANGDVKYASPALALAVGKGEFELRGTGLADVVHPDDQRAVMQALYKVQRRPGDSIEVMSRVRDPQGQWRWMQSRLHNLLEDPHVRGIVCNTRDVHEQYLLREQLSHDAFHDALTGLGNLAHARQLLESRQFGSIEGCSTVLLADLDGFKAINDTYGHACGDSVLEAVGARLRSCLSDGASVCRIGGDEFLVMINESSDPAQVARTVLGELNQTVLVDGHQHSAAASIGIARSCDAASADELLRNADLAMYAAKAQGRGLAVWYESKMHEAATQRMLIQRGLRVATANGSFRLVYQPVVSLPSGEIVGAEALLRWDDDVLGSIPPDVFIPIAETSGMSAEIDRWVIDNACAQVASWTAAGLEPPTVHVNVSRRQINADLPDLVADAIHRHGVAPGGLGIELTESAVLPDADYAKSVLDSLRSLGVSIALDDFGTGQSSLSQLSKLPIDFVKIDKSFVIPSQDDPHALRLLASIAGVCRALELPVLAEGVETAEAVTNLVSMGVDFAQGYHFSRPVPPAAFALLLQARIPRQRPQAQGPRRWASAAS